MNRKTLDKYRFVKLKILDSLLAAEKKNTDGKISRKASHIRNSCPQKKQSSLKNVTDASSGSLHFDNNKTSQTHKQTKETKQYCSKLNALTGKIQPISVL